MCRSVKIVLKVHENAYICKIGVLDGNVFNVVTITLQRIQPEERRFFTLMMVGVMLVFK